MKAPLRLSYSDMYPGFDEHDNLVTRSLRVVFEVEIVPMQEAELLVFGDFGTRHWRFPGRKAYLTGENMRPDFNQCDLAFTPYEVTGDSRAVRLPFYALVLNNPEALTVARRQEARGTREGFCCFIASNPRCRERNRAFKALHRRRHVDSWGRVFNNTGSTAGDKAACLRNYRFNLAFENSSDTGYITEKLVDPLLEGTIPIYWGAPDVGRDFNPGCMINAADFSSPDELAEAVIAIDSDSGRRRELLTAPIFAGDGMPQALRGDTIRLAVQDLMLNRKPASRIHRQRRVREHIHDSRGWLGNKWDALSCKTEVLAWRLGWR